MKSKCVSLPLKCLKCFSRCKQWNLPWWQHFRVCKVHPTEFWEFWTGFIKIHDPQWGEMFGLQSPSTYAAQKENISGSSRSWVSLTLSAPRETPPASPAGVVSVVPAKPGRRGVGGDGKSLDWPRLSKGTLVLRLNPGPLFFWAWIHFFMWSRNASQTMRASGLSTERRWDLCKLFHLSVA